VDTPISAEGLTENFFAPGDSRFIVNPMKKFFYRCTQCGQEYEISPEIMLCPVCAAEQKPDEPLRGVLQVVAEGKTPDPRNIYEFLPVEKEFFPDMPVGSTPLWRPKNLRKILGFPNLFLKDDTANPTGSLKDRASFLVAAFAKKFGIKKIVVASTGNAGSSMAGVGACAGLEVILFVPKTAPRAKLVQALQYGAKLMPVDGNYDLAFDLSLQYSKKHGGLNRNTAYNPMTIEGKKTVAIEIFNQIGGIPDYVFVPVGDGVILAGTYRGFEDLQKFGLAKKIPTIYAVQSEGSCAVCRALATGNFDRPIPSKTIADSISVDIPRNGYYAVELLRRHNGKCITVSDEEILRAQKILSETTGLFAEPAGATSLAGFIKVKDQIPADATVVLLITGTGLKDIDSATKILEFPDGAIKSV